MKNLDGNLNKHYKNKKIMETFITKDNTNKTLSSFDEKSVQDIEEQYKKIIELSKEFNSLINVDSQSIDENKYSNTILKEKKKYIQRTLERELEKYSFFLERNKTINIRELMVKLISNKDLKKEIDKEEKEMSNIKEEILKEYENFYQNSLIIKNKTMEIKEKIEKIISDGSDYILDDTSMLLEIVKDLKKEDNLPLLIFDNFIPEVNEEKIINTIIKNIFESFFEMPFEQMFLSTADNLGDELIREYIFKNVKKEKVKILKINNFLFKNSEKVNGVVKNKYT